MDYRKLRDIAIILLLAISITNAYEVDVDDIATVEDEENYVDFHSSDEESHRVGKILWPYPLSDKDSMKDDQSAQSQNETEDKKEVEDDKLDEKREEDELVEKKEEKLGEKRERRFLYHSYPQSPVVDIMMQTLAVNYSPNNPSDPFDFLRDSYPLPKGYTQPLDEYDYVIVGASAAGSVLAARLTEDKPKATVLLLEAGRPEMMLSDIPMMQPYIQRTDYTWPYTMEHQPGVCMGSEEGRCFWPRGKAVGGTSVIDYMLYTRGRPQEWNRIASDGNYGWSFNEVLPYFKKSERAEVKKYKNASYRGREGELVVENVPFRTGLVEAFLNAGKQAGQPSKIDVNSPDQTGFGYIQMMSDKGHRLSAAKAFLHPNKKRKNLHILPESRATKVIIEPQSKRAYAVEYINNRGIKCTVRCRREIILSAGPIASPQLLMLSGVGPQEQLQRLGIPVIKDLPVGRNLYNHIAFPGVVFKLDSTNASLLEHKVATVANFVQWVQFGDGLMTSPATFEASGYVKTALSDDREHIPDIELISMGASINMDEGSMFRKSWKITDKTYKLGFGSLNGRDTWSAIPVLLQPRSRGCLELRDANPFSHPKLYGNYFTDPKDMAVMLEAVRYVIRLGQSEAFRRYNAKLHLGEYPECRTHPPGSDSYWECAIRTLVITMHDQVATCRMGHPNDPEAVVDPELRVYGVEGLRVVDASVIPRPLSAHTTAPSIMIGERVADLIKRTWSNVVA